MSISDLIYIDSAGYNFPDYPTVLAEAQNEIKVIYGADINLAADTQDGQYVAAQSLALFETIQLVGAVYNSFSPATALNDALTRNVKINGISRQVPTFSQVNLDIVGQAGTQITNGVAEDLTSQNWLLPIVVNIPLSGTTTVTAIAEKVGTIPAEAGTITKIATPTKGWQSVNNPLAATEGAPIESNANLRLRQSRSTMLPNQTVLDGILGGVASVIGVTQEKGYENDSDFVDADGIPAGNIAIVVEGGIAQDIGDAISVKKPPGVPTFGSTSVITYDSRGVPNEIFYSQVTSVPISVKLTLVALEGYISPTGEAIRAEIASYISNLGIGSDIYISKVYAAASLCNNVDPDTFDIQNGSIELSRGGDPFLPVNIPIAFSEDATCIIADIELLEI